MNSVVVIEKSDPFEEGYNAAIDGVSQKDNPYPSNSREYVNWDKGFLAFEEEDHDA